MEELILASAGPLTAVERRIQAFARWMGVPVTTASVDAEGDVPWRILTGGENRQCCVVASAETLAKMHAAWPRLLESLVSGWWANLLVFGWSDSVRYRDVLAWLAGDQVRGPSSLTQGQDQFELPQGGRTFSRQLAGLRFSTGQKLSVATFDWAVNRIAAEAIMQVGNHPVLVHSRKASCNVFLLATSEVADVDEPVRAGTGLEGYYPQLIPWLMFFRHSFPETSWHGSMSTAHLVIDDPLLAERYGFLDYRALLTSMQREGYGTSIAFIPWNYRRTSSRVAASLFGGRPELSICVHGCDHTNKEFDGTDQALLEWKAGVALERMEQHRARTGLPFDRVMIFPQGRFSTDAMRALRAADFIAAVNSTCLPTDEKRDALKIGDLLRPAVNRFHGFPVFPRRYPRRSLDSALDLFLGRPALLVEHHNYFQGGLERLEEFVRGLRAVDPALTWPPLSWQLTRSCLRRCLSDHVTEVKFFTNKFRMESRETDRRQFRLSKYEGDVSYVDRVLVDGVRVPFMFRENAIEFEFEADPGEGRNVEIVDRAPAPPGTRRAGLIYSIGVLGRRSLSEFRDGALARHPRLLRCATGLASGLRLTGE